MVLSLILASILAWSIETACDSPGGVLPDDHAFYVSVIRIQHEVGADSATVEFTIFSDDLQSGLRAAFGEGPCSLDELCECKAQASEYVKDRTGIEINSQAVGMRLMHCEQVGDTHKLLFTIPSAQNWSRVIISSSILMEIFPTQNNMVYLHSGEFKTTARLTARKPSAAIDLN